MSLTIARSAPRVLSDALVMTSDVSAVVARVRVGLAGRELWHLSDCIPAKV